MDSNECWSEAILWMHAKRKNQIIQTYIISSEPNQQNSATKIPPKFRIWALEFIHILVDFEIQIESYCKNSIFFNLEISCPPRDSHFLERILENSSVFSRIFKHFSSKRKRHLCQKYFMNIFGQNIKIARNACNFK